MYSSHSMSHRVHETQPHASPPFITKRNFRHSCVSSKVPTIFHPTPKGITAIRGGNLIFFFACKTSLLARCIRAWRGERSVFCMLCTRGEFRGCCAYGCIRIPHFLWDSSWPISIKRGRAKNREKISSPPGRGATEIPSSPTSTTLF